jgi:hypothetical protein
MSSDRSALSVRTGLAAEYWVPLAADEGRDAAREPGRENAPQLDGSRPAGKARVCAGCAEMRVCTGCNAPPAPA